MLTTEFYLELKKNDYNMKDLTGFPHKDIFRRTSQLMIESKNTSLPLLKSGTVEIEEIFAHLLFSFIYVQKEIKKSETIPDFNLLMSSIFVYEKILKTYLSGDARSTVLILSAIFDYAQKNKNSEEIKEEYSYGNCSAFFGRVIQEFQKNEAGTHLDLIAKRYNLMDAGITVYDIQQTEVFLFDKKHGLYGRELPTVSIFDTRPTLVQIIEKNQKLKPIQRRD